MCGSRVCCSEQHKQHVQRYLHMVHLIVIAVFIQRSSLKKLPKIYILKNIDNYHNSVILDKILESILNFKQPQNSRRIDPVNLEKGKQRYKKLTHKMSTTEIKKMLHDDDDDKIILKPKEPEEEIVRDKQAVVVENELADSLSKHSSALLESPFVENKGKNDFLVMKPDTVDEFVTVIPNDMYYNIEKKCVNWLDDCSLQGVKARLMQKVRSPFM